MRYEFPFPLAGERIPLIVVGLCAMAESHVRAFIFKIYDARNVFLFSREGI